MKPLFWFIYVVIFIATVGVLMLTAFDFLPGAPYGFIDKSGKVTMRRSTFGNILLTSDFSDGLAVEWYFDNQSKRFINRSGEIAFNEYFEDAQMFYQSLAAVKVQNKFGYIDRAGQMVIKPKFENACPFVNNYAAVKLSGRWGYIDRSGNLKISAKFERVLPFYNYEIACVLFCGKVGYINRLGDFVISPRFKTGTSFSAGRAYVDNHFYIDHNGKVIFFTENTNSSDINREILAGIPLTLFYNGYSNPEVRLAATDPSPTTHVFSEGLAAVSINQLDGYVDDSGKLIIAPQFQRAYPFREGRALIMKNEKFGFIDNNGRIVIEPKYEMAGYFSEQLAPVQLKDGKWGYIDRDGKLAVRAKYSSAGEFCDGLAKVGNRLIWP